MMDSYKVADELYKRGYYDARKEVGYDPRACKEWQKVVDALSERKSRDHVLQVFRQVESIVYQHGTQEDIDSMLEAIDLLEVE